VSFIAVFLYELEPAAAERFSAAYGPDGESARFFARGDGYLGTELWRSSMSGEYLVVDRWTSEAAYQTFLRAHEADYRRRSEKSEELYVRERPIGRFER
jgi:heme-degrading monooxygenase HmoA